MLSIYSSTGQTITPRVFGSDGGTMDETLISRDPDSVELTYTAKVNFDYPDWPIIECTKVLGSVQGFNIALDPSEWLARVALRLVVSADDGEQIADSSGFTGRDELVVNWACRGHHLSRPIIGSLRLTPSADLGEFVYPNDPSGDNVELTISAFGQIGGILIELPDTRLTHSANSLKVNLQSHTIAVHP